jgi:hypothetical protein
VSGLKTVNVIQIISGLGILLLLRVWKTTKICSV